MAVVVRITITGAAEVIRALDRVPAENLKDLRKANLELSRLLAGKIKAAATGEGRQAAALASTVRPFGGVVPGVLAGGSSVVTANGGRAFDLLFASEFGAVFKYGWYADPKYRQSMGRQYKVRRSSYWFFKTVDANSSEIIEAWGKVADETVRKFGEG